MKSRPLESVWFDYNEVEQHIRSRHPGCPPHAARHIAKRVAKREWFAVSVGRAVGIMIAAYVRHEKTRYERLLKDGVPRSEAMALAREKLEATLLKWSMPRELNEAHQPIAVPREEQPL